MCDKHDIVYSWIIFLNALCMHQLAIVFFFDLAKEKCYLFCLSAYSRLGVTTADICIFITWHLFYGRMPFLPPTLSLEGKLSHLFST